MLESARILLEIFAARLGSARILFETKLLENARLGFQIPCSKSPTVPLNITFISIQFNSIQFNSIQFSSVQFNSVQFNSIQFSSIQLSSVQFSSIQYDTIQMKHI